MSRVMTAALAYPFIPGLDSGADADVEGVLDACEGALAAYLGFPEISAGTHQLVSGTYTVHLDEPEADEPRALQLPMCPVTSITSVHDDPLWSYGADRLVASSNYTEIGHMGQIVLNPDASHVWSRGLRNLKIVCVAGFTAGSPPPALKQAIGQYLAITWARQKGGAGRKTATAGKQRSNYDLPPIPNPVKQLLRGFRCPSFYGMG